LAIGVAAGAGAAHAVRGGLFHACLRFLVVQIGQRQQELAFKTETTKLHVEWAIWSNLAAASENPVTSKVKVSYRYAGGSGLDLVECCRRHAEVKKGMSAIVPDASASVPRPRA